MCKWYLLITIIIFVIIPSCNDNGMPENKSLDSIYATYVISASEGDELVTALVQFHSGRSDGPGIFLKEPSKVLLDEKLLTPDSARESGVFYELQEPIEELEGKHTIRLIDEEGKEYREEFVFTPLELTEEMPETISRKEVVLKFKDIMEKQPVRVVMTDTSIDGEGINEIDTIINNRLDLTRLCSGVTNGPVMLQLFCEQEGWLKSYKGEIYITYTLKREFELKD